MENVQHLRRIVNMKLLILNEKLHYNKSLHIRNVVTQIYPKTTSPIQSKMRRRLRKREGTLIRNNMGKMEVKQLENVQHPRRKLNIKLPEAKHWKTYGGRNIFKRLIQK